MAEEFDFHPMWESLGMNLADHDLLLGAVGQMYGDMFLTQNNRPKSTSYLDFVATNIHSGRIKEMLDKKEAGETVDEMLDAIAERYFKINCAVFTPNDQRMKDIVQMAKDLHADGIVDVALQFCTLYEMESFAVEKAAEEVGIPFMHITTDYAGEDAVQLQTRIEAFLETI